MNKKIIDILDNLDSEIDLSDTYEIKQIKPSEIFSNNSNDIKKDLQDLNISTRKYAKINNKKNNINFDSIINNNKLEDINLDTNNKNSKNNNSNNNKKKKNKTVQIKKEKYIKIRFLVKINLFFKNLIYSIGIFLKNLNYSKDIFFKNLRWKIKYLKFNLFFKNKLNNSSIDLDNSSIDLDNSYIEENIVDEKTTEPIWFMKINYFFTKKFFIYSWVIFLFIFFIMIISKNIIEKRITSGYEKILSIKDNYSDIDFVKKQIKDAKNDFFISNILFTPFRILPNTDIKNWYYIIKWWTEITNILEKSLEIYTWTKQFILQSWWIENVKLTNLLFNIKNDFWEINSLLYKTIISYDKIKNLSNKDLSNKLNFAKSKLKEGYKLVNLLNNDYDIFLSLLWHNNERKYLIVFQNNDEIRPTWWFMWSLATINIKNWKVIDFAKEDVYSYEWDIDKVLINKELAPEWLNKITETFWFRDSNYYIDFEESSNSIKWFLDKIDRNIDWIVYINQNTILDFLKYTWWIKFDELWETITEENFSLIISTLVEAKVFKVWALWTPKQILFDFANVFLDLLKEKKDYYIYLDIIKKNIISRDLVLYSFKPEENNLLWKLWLNWKINYQDTLDFAYPVVTSVWSNKSDRYVELKYKKNIVKNSDCSIDTNLDIYRTHLFSKIEEQKVIDLLNNHWVTKDKEKLLNIQWKWDNKSYIRVLLPKSAIVEEKEWMNIKKFDNFVMVDYYHNTRVLESTNFEIKYKLPNLKCTDYKFKLYKQSWIRNYDLEINDSNNLLKEIWIKGDYIY